MRDPTQTIWRTVVVAGAMLGTPACKAKPAATTPAPASNTAPATAPATPEANAKPDPTTSDPGDPCNAPDSPTRARGADDDGGGGAGRGFILS
jgi:hypothetical protein